MGELLDIIGFYMRSLTILLGSVVIFLSGFFISWLYDRNSNGNVLGIIVRVTPTSGINLTITLTVTPTLIPTSSPTPTIKLSPTSEPTLTPTPTFIPLPQFSSQEIHAFIERFAGQYGVDPNVLRHIAVCESGFNAGSVNGDYAGLFQFSTITWKNNRIPMGEDNDPHLRFNAEEATQTAAYMLSIGKRYIWPNCMP